MSGYTGQSVLSGAIGNAKGVVWGTDDTRVRAIWRVLLAGIFIVQLTEIAAVTIVGHLELEGRVFLGVGQAVSLAILLVGWAMYIDRRPLSDYGYSLSDSWVVDTLAGFLAALVGFGVWLSMGSVVGWADVEMAMTAPEGSVIIGLGVFLIGAVLNIWVQETIFMGMVLKNAAEGLSRRGVTATHAVIGAWAVAVLLFTLLHQPSTLGRVVNLVIGLGLFGLLYVQTGELALPIGVHTGVNYAGGVLVISPSFAGQQPSLFEVTNSLSGVLGSLNSGAVPQVIIAYLVALGWLKLRRKDLSIQTGLTHWTER